VQYGEFWNEPCYALGNACDVVCDVFGTFTPMVRIEKKTMKNKLTEAANFPQDDQYDVAKIDAHRRPRLTFRHLNRLRKVNELKQLEMQEYRRFVRMMYGKPEEDAGGF